MAVTWLLLSLSVLLISPVGTEKSRGSRVQRRTLWTGDTATALYLIEETGYYYLTWLTSMIVTDKHLSTVSRKLVVFIFYIFNVIDSIEWSKANLPQMIRDDLVWTARTGDPMQLLEERKLFAMKKKLLNNVYISEKKMNDNFINCYSLLACQWLLELPLLPVHSGCFWSPKRLVSPLLRRNQHPAPMILREEVTCLEAFPCLRRGGTAVSAGGSGTWGGIGSRK